MPCSPTRTAPANPPAPRSPRPHRPSRGANARSSQCPQESFDVVLRLRVGRIAPGRGVVVPGDEIPGHLDDGDALRRKIDQRPPVAAGATVRAVLIVLARRIVGIEDLARLVPQQYRVAL